MEKEIPGDKQKLKEFMTTVPSTTGKYLHTKEGNKYTHEAIGKNKLYYNTLYAS